MHVVNSGTHFLYIFIPKTKMHSTIISCNYYFNILNRNEIIKIATDEAFHP